MLEKSLKKGGLLSTYSLRKIIMKNLETNQSYTIFSRMKEVFEGVLSMFDGDKYTISDYDEISLPDELLKHSEKLAEKAKQYEINGKLLNTIKQLSHEQQSASTMKAEKPRTKQLNNKQINTAQKLTNRNIITDKELGEDR